MTLHHIADHYERVDTVPEPVDGHELYAGGTDLIPLTRTGVLEIHTLVDIKSSGLPATITADAGGWSIGALTTLSELEAHADIGAQFPAIGEALRESATHQIRNRATVGGNLLQRPRCNYFRDAAVSCWMKGGHGCPAKEGYNEHHGLVDGECVAVQPSDLASVLVAVDAHVTVATRGASSGGTPMPLTELLAPPDEDRRSLHRLARDQVIESIGFTSSPSMRSTYVKAMDRATWQFALVGVAAVVELGSDDEVTGARLVASGVGPVPKVLDRSGSTLIGKRLDADSIAAAAQASGEGLTPLSENGYKVPLLAGLVRRALESFS